MSEKAEKLMADLLPGRARIAVALYDADHGRAFRGVPKHAITVDVGSREALSRLWRAIENLTAKGEWR